VNTQEPGTDPKKTKPGSVPIIAIDGPSASGKGTVAARVADALGFHYLDSGALYRLVALAALERGLSLTDSASLARVAGGMDASFGPGWVRLDGKEVSEALRTELVSAAASKVASQPPVRDALLARQRAFQAPPGLVADGRDMGSVVFPDASLKVYLTADVGTRAERRYKQLMEKGMYARMEDVVEDLASRDARDASRAVSPLKHYPDANFLDTTRLTVEQAVQRILDWWRDKAAG
jgi:cytidylate kinase